MYINRMIIILKILLKFIESNENSIYNERIYIENYFNIYLQHIFNHHI